MGINLSDFASQNLKELENIKKDIKTTKNNVEGIDFETFVNTKMIDSETVALSYDSINNEVDVYYKGDATGTSSFPMLLEEYTTFCNDFFEINTNEKYNNSKWRYDRDGNLIRVFTVLPPVTKAPNVTINISRCPDYEHIWDDVLVPDNIKKILAEIMTKRFLVIGQSGSGKTYLLNRTLGGTFKSPNNYNASVYEKVKNNRICLVEEFHELFQPNDNTICLDSCPVKPGEVNVFSYIVQQTNLMRLDNVFCGEVKGAETFHFINNLTAGMQGGTTCHGGSVEDGLKRIQTLCMFSPECRDLNFAGMMVAKAIDYCIYVDKETHSIKNIVQLNHNYNVGTGVFNTTDIYKG